MVECSHAERATSDTGVSLFFHPPRAQEHAGDGGNVVSVGQKPSSPSHDLCRLLSTEQRLPLSLHALAPLRTPGLASYAARALACLTITCPVAHTRPHSPPTDTRALRSTHTPSKS